MGVIAIVAIVAEVEVTIDCRSFYQYEIDHHNHDHGDDEECCPSDGFEPWRYEVNYYAALIFSGIPIQPFSGSTLR